MPDWANKTIKYNPDERSLKVPFSFFFDLECVLKKLQSIQNNQEKFYTEKKVDIAFWLSIIYKLFI